MPDALEKGGLYLTRMEGQSIEITCGDKKAVLTIVNFYETPNYKMVRLQIKGDKAIKFYRI